MPDLLHHPQLGEVVLQFLPTKELLNTRLVDSKMEPLVEEVTKEQTRKELRRFFLEPKKHRQSKPEYAIAAHLAHLPMSEEQWLDLIGDGQGMLPRGLSEKRRDREKVNDPRRGMAVLLSSECQVPIPVLPGEYNYKQGDIQWLSQRETGTRTTPATVDAHRPGSLHLGIPPRPLDTSLQLKVGSHVTSLSIIGGEGITSIGPKVLHQCPNLKRLTLNGFHNVKTIGREFIASCPKLESVSLFGFTSVTTIADNFLDDCPKLKSLKVAEGCLERLVSIGPSFLSGSRSLTCLLPRLPALRSIADFGLTGTACATIDLGLSFPSLERVGTSFLKNSMVSTLIMSCDLKEVGPDFCADCKHLGTVDCKAFSKVKTVPKGFFQRARFDRLDVSPLATAINDGFLSGVTGSVDGLHKLHCVTSIGHDFLAKSKLGEDFRRFDLTGFSCLQEVGDGFLKSCVGLHRVDLSACSHLTSIGADFFADNDTLQELDISGLHGVEVIGSGTFTKCPKLKEIATTGSSNLVRTVASDLLSHKGEV